MALFLLTLRWFWLDYRITSFRLRVWITMQKPGWTDLEGVRFLSRRSRYLRTELNRLRTDAARFHSADARLPSMNRDLNIADERLLQLERLYTT